MPTTEELTDPIMWDRFKAELDRQAAFKMEAARVIAELARAHDRTRTDVSIALRSIAESIERS